MDKLEHTSKLLNELNGKQVVFGCSGGVDSMVLLYLLHREGIQPMVIHVNYQKRGKASDLDAQLVAQTCIKYGFCYKVIKYTAPEKQGNFQEQARNFRLNIFQEFKQDSITMLAHHADDQIETFFMNLARKSGVMGMAAMEEKSSKVIRPLLNWSKDEIYSFAKEHSIEWREDESNVANDYVRNQWRNVLIPEMEKATPSIKESAFFLAQKFQETQKVIEQKVDPVIASIHESSKLDLELAKLLPEDYLFEIWRQLKQEPSHFESFQKLLYSQKGKYIKLKGLFDKVINEGSYLHFVRKKQFERRYEIEISKVSALPETFDKWAVYLDANQIEGELVLRKWQQGDRFSPIGMKGSKLVSDIITDAKVPNHQRPDIHVLTDSKHILWIPGVKVSRYTIASENSKDIVQVKVHKIN